MPADELPEAKSPMTCPRCGIANPSRAKFCLNCGAGLERVCARCGARVRAGANHCQTCGERLPAETLTGELGFAAVGRSPISLAGLPQSQRFIEGERKFVTILFADIKGSLELIAGRDPETVRSILGSAIEVVTEPVHRFDGTVNRIQGDGLMALFGAPRAHEDHALGACYAAIAMQQAMVRCARQTREAYGVELQLRVGLNSGEVVVHTIVNDLSMDYDAAGEPVHIASRMEQLATPGSSWMTAATYSLVKSVIDVRELGRVAVKGLAEPTCIFELIGAKPGHRRAVRGSARKLTTFIDRNAAVSDLHKALANTLAGSGRIVSLVGAPGCGKSRIVQEFLNSEQARACVVLQDRAVSFDENASYQPILRILGSYFDLQVADDTATIREKIIQAIGSDETLQARLPALLALHNLPAIDPEWQSLEPAQRRQRMLDAIRALLLSAARRQPLIAVLEDLHWLDAESQSALDVLVDALQSAPLLLLLTFRPEYRHTWAGKPHYSEIALPPLSRADATDMLNALVGTGRDLAPLNGLVFDRTEGNPFFIEESVHALIDEGVLAAESGAFRLLKPIESIQVPSNVRTVLAARIDRLSSVDKQILASAAVIGRDVPETLLRAIVGAPHQDLRTALARLREADFIYEMSRFPDLQYTFRHPLTHEVCYSGLLRETRRQLHARILFAMEHLYADRLAEHLERLAFHALRADLWEKAAHYAREAGGKAAARSANKDAVALFEQALAALKRLPASRETRAATIDVCFSLRDPLFRLGRLDRVVECLNEAEGLMAGADDDQRTGQLLIFQSHVLWLIGDYKNASAAATSARAVAARRGDLALEARAGFQLGLCFLGLCDFRSAISSMQETLRHLDDASLQERYGLDTALAIVASSFLARALAEVGEFSEANRVSAEAQRSADVVNKPFSRIFADLGAGFTAERQGCFLAAIDCLERALEQCEVAESQLMAAPVASALGLTYLRTGRADDAISLLKSAVDSAAEMGLLFHQPLRLGQLAEGLLAIGRAEDALTYATSAISLANKQGERGARAYAEYVLGSIRWRLDEGNFDAACEHYRGAIAIASELSMRPLVAHCRFALGECYGANRRPREASAELSAALDLFRALGMTTWAERADAVLTDPGATP